MPGAFTCAVSKRFSVAGGGLAARPHSCMVLTEITYESIISRCPRGWYRRYRFRPYGQTESAGGTLRRDDDNKLIKANREEILVMETTVLSSYSIQGRHSWPEKRPVRQSVGAAIDDVTSSLLEYLVEGVDENAYEESLERFIRIRAVQEYTASQAVGFIFSLKNAILESPGYALVARDESDGEFLVFNRIDRMALARSTATPLS